jgi:Protein of unknown function (DUF1585)/Protein of unknown function (DUF1592)
MHRVRSERSLSVPRVTMKSSAARSEAISTRRVIRAVNIRFLAILALVAPVASADTRTLADYRDFRSLSIDLVGRFPTRDEIATMEKPGFDRDAWIDAHVGTPQYAARLTRVYMDLLRLEVSNAVQVTPAATTLRRIQILGPDKKQVYVYYRRGQRRTRDATDGEFCLTSTETGLELTPGQPPKGTAIEVKKDVLDANTVVVRPWWLYRDYVEIAPSKRYGSEWTDFDPSYVPSDKLLKEADGTPTTEVRVCKEETLTADVGSIYATGRVPPPKGATPPPPRIRPLPLDDGYAKTHKGEPISCRDGLAVSMSANCGCGIGLQYCMPGDSDANDPGAYMLPSHSPVGIEGALPLAEQSVSTWYKYWWTQEVEHFLTHVFTDDRDFRDVLTAKYTWANGPLAQYYRSTVPAGCCTRERAFGLLEDKEPLFAASSIPPSLFAHDAGTWLYVPDRGPQASGILSMPVFLEKYASRRARAAAVYTAFQCKAFVSSDAELTPSTEPNLTIRPGCSSCHATLEPLAAYFSRIEESNAVYLPKEQFPVKNPLCKLQKNGKAAGFCDAFYDPSFTDGNAGTLRGAYASADHAEAGMLGLARVVTASPEFASCTVSRVTASLLGRALSPDDDDLVHHLTDVFVHGGYRMKALVVAVLRSGAYRNVNNQRSQAVELPTPGAPHDSIHGGT